MTDTAPTEHHPDCDGSITWQAVCAGCAADPRCANCRRVHDRAVSCEHVR